MNERETEEDTVKKNILALILIALVMLELPWLVLKLVQGPDALTAVLLLFFIVDPLFSIFLGVFAGRDAKSRWYLPVLTAALYVAGAWLFFDRGETAFLLYAAGYLALGLVAMLLTAFLRRRRAAP